jgi:hypothetical protein
MAQTKPKAGQFYGVSDNGTDGQFLRTDGAGGMSWAAPIVEPTLTSIDYPGTQTAADPAGGESIIMNGTGFQTGITCTVGGTSATTAFNSATQITITSPAKAAGQYNVTATNTDGGTVTENNFIQYSGVPVWSTNSGSLGSVMEGASASFQVTATEGSDTIEYAVTTGSLPSGLSLATATGAITGTAPSVSADTTSTFSITATDDENQTSSARSFSITVTNDVPSNYFNTVLYTGTSPGTQSVNTVGFKPDLVWIKGIDETYNHVLTDSVRGVSERLNSNTTAAESDWSPNGVSAFNTTGFNVTAPGGQGYGVNQSGIDYVAWNFKAGGAPTATNAAAAGSVPTLGSVMIDGTASTSALAGTLAIQKISVNRTLGFSMVRYTGGTGTLPHELGTTPRIIIQKAIGAINPWYTYIPPGVIDSNYNYLELNTSATVGQTGSTAPTSTTFNPVSSSGDFIAYMFTSVTGFTKVDKYTGNGNSNGPMIETGFEPAYIMVKEAVGTTNNWYLYDNKRSPSNPRNKLLAANNADAESTNTSMNMNWYANGFQPIDTGGGMNRSGSTYVYLAIAADPSTTTPSLANSFDTVLFTPTTSSSALPVTGMGFQPDLVWAKYIDGAMNHYLVDSVRGVSSIMYPNKNDLPYTASPYVQSFDSDGITYINNLFNRTATDSMVAWAWKAGGGIPSINTDGTIDSIVSVNQAAGFSIAQYTGTGSAATIAHGLGAVPKMTIIKVLTGTYARDWVVFHSDLTAYTYEVYLDNQGSEYNSAGAMQAAAPTTTLISLGGDDYVNGSGNKYICYSFAEVAGFSSFGTYEATGSAGTPTITTGFQPDWVMIKNIDRTQEWIVIDSVRGLNKSLIPDSDAAEGINGNIITTNATSFTINVSGGGINYANGDTMIYAAFKIN